MYKLLHLCCFLVLCQFSQAQAPLASGYILSLKPSSSKRQLETSLGQEAKVQAIFGEHTYCVQGPNLPSLETLKQLPFVAFAQANHPVELRHCDELNPNDPRFDEQWNLSKINAPQAWTFTQGGTTALGDTIVVAILDIGFNPHADLLENLFTNWAEVPNNNLDDDSNGYIDDVTGWSYYDNSDNHPPANHGTAVAGLVGAKGNNDIGLSGVNWNIKILRVSLLNFDEASVLQAYNYVLRMKRLYLQSNGQRGANILVMNNSFGIDLAQPNNHPLWCAALDSLGQAGILTVAATSNNPYNVDVQGDMPTACPSDFLISVTGSDRQDRDIDAGYGRLSIDLAAPTDYVPTLMQTQSYFEQGGTSSAAPQVAGAAALLLSYPNQSWGEMIKNQPTEALLRIKDILIHSTDDAADFNDKSVSEGRLNLGASMEELHAWYSQTFSITPLVYPNPSQGQAQLRVFSPNASQLDMQVFNSLGQDLRTTSFELVPGWQDIALNMEPGAYILQLSSEGQRVTLRHVVLP
jgi:subtilisin family serine protease